MLPMDMRIFVVGILENFDYMLAVAVHLVRQRTQQPLSQRIVDVTWSPHWSKHDLSMHCLPTTLSDCL